jgi:archaellum biogenesis protein FlaJ (TadC family)
MIETVMIETIAVLYEEHQLALGVLAGLSVVMFFASLLSLPFLVSLIPADYFQYAEPYRTSHDFKHPVIRHLIIAIKNALGWLLIIAGIIMLVLPGQGLITIVTGLMLINFPGKRSVERKLVGNRRILRTINWLRAKRNREPLIAPEQ